MQKTDKLSGSKVMVWGYFSAEETGPLVQVKRKIYQSVYKNKLIHHTRPMLKNHKFRYFRHDNHPKQGAKLVQQYLKSKLWPAKIPDWPSKSPGLNPCETLWSILDHEVQIM